MNVQAAGTGTWGTWDPKICTHFSPSSPSKLLYQYFNLGRGMCSFYWCYIFSFVTFFTGAEGKTYVVL